MNIIVVEDEPPLLRDLVNCIHECNENWHVIGMATNGEDALELLTTEGVPDLLITDIKMPVIDGLQLSKRLKVLYPQLPIIILSGYKEFEYAKTALTLGLHDYLLKPFSIETLKSTLEGIERGINIFRYNQIRRIIESELYNVSINNESANFNNYLQLTASCGYLTDPSIDCDLPETFLWNRIDIEELVKNCFKNHQTWVVDGWTSVEKVILIDLEGYEQEELFRQINIMFKLFATGKLSVNIIVGNMNTTLTDVKTIYIHHRKLLDKNCGLVGENLLYESHLTLDVTDSKIIVDSKYMNILKKAITDGNKIIINSIVTSVLNRYKELNSPLYIIKKELTTIFLDLYKDQNIHDVSFKDISSSLQIIFGKSIDFFTLSHNITEYLLINFVNIGTRPVLMDDMIQVTRQYIEENYTKQIRGEDISKRIGLVYSYLSRLFKEEVGVTPSTYIVNLRIEQAKKILEQDSGIMIKDVAFAVGYSDSNHFSRIFKRVEGIYPTEYLNSLKKNNFNN